MMESTRPRPSTRALEALRRAAMPLALALLLPGSVAAGHGTWVKRWAEQPEGLAGRIVILKLGVFGTRGNFRRTLRPGDAKRLCASDLRRIAWITHRLSPGEVLTPASGTRLARTLRAQPDIGCFGELQFDIEPLNGVPEWLPPYLGALVSGLPDHGIRLAVPPLATFPTVGNTWTPAHAETVLPHVRGLDFMGYDTGASAKDYERILHTTLALTARAPADKSFLLGLPAYQDRTRLHPLDVENTTGALSALKNTPRDGLIALCGNRLAFAYYAGWTMTAKDVAVAREIDGWSKDVCKTN